MSVPERETVRTLTRNPGLFLGGAVVAAAWTIAQVVAAAPVMFVSLPRNTQMVFAFTFASVVSVLVLPATLAGLYAMARQAHDGGVSIRRTVPLYVGGCLRHARDLFVATVTFRVVALAPAAVAFAALLAGDTAVNYWRYAGGFSGPAFGVVPLLFVWLYAMVAGAVGRLTFAFYDLSVLFAGVSPRRGPRAALRFTRRRPRALLRYGVGRFLLWTPMIPVLVLEALLVTGEVTPADAWTGLVLFLATAFALCTLTTTLLAAYHVVVYERAVEPVLREPATTGTRVAVDSPAVAPPPGVESPDRSADGGPAEGLTRRRLFAVSFAALLVVSMAVGTAAIRVNDIRPMPGDDPGPVDDSMAGAEIVVNAGHLLANGSHRVQSAHYSVNDTTGERQLLMETEVAVDRSNRQARIGGGVRADEDGDELHRTELYGSGTTTALAYTGGQPPEDVPVRARFFGETADEWTVMYVPGYSLAEAAAVDDFPDAEDGDWRVVERTDDEVVVGYTAEPEDPDEGGRALESERVRLTVDAETGRPTHLVRNETYVERENGTVVDRSHGVEETTYGGYGDPAVERPEPIGPRGPVEWLWSLVYY